MSQRWARSLHVTSSQLFVTFTGQLFHLVTSDGSSSVSSLLRFFVFVRAEAYSKMRKSRRSQRRRRSAAKLEALNPRPQSHPTTTLHGGAAQTPARSHQVRAFTVELQLCCLSREFFNRLNHHPKIHEPEETCACNFSG